MLPIHFFINHECVVIINGSGKTLYLPLIYPSHHPVLSSTTLKYLIPVPLPSEPPLRYDSDPPPQASALHCDARNNTRTRHSGGSASPLRCASPFRSTSFHRPHYCFLLCGAKRERKLRIDLSWITVYR